MFVRTARASVRAVVVHGGLAAEGATTGGTSSSGRFRAQRQRETCARERSGLRRLINVTAIIPALTVPRDEFRVKRLGGKPAVVGAGSGRRAGARRSSVEFAQARRSSCRRSSPP